MERLVEPERHELFERLRRCDDLFGRMLLIGKIKAYDRAALARSAREDG